MRGPWFVLRLRQWTYSEPGLWSSTQDHQPRLYATMRNAQRARDNVPTQDFPIPHGRCFTREDIRIIPVYVKRVSWFTAAANTFIRR